MDPIETLYKLAIEAAPGATVRASIELHGGGNIIRTKLCKVTLTSPEIMGEIASQGHTPEVATKGLAKRWAKARRQFAIGLVLSECRRLAGYLSPQQEQLWEQYLSFSEAPTYSEYLRRAASCRCAAVEMGKKPARVAA